MEYSKKAVPEYRASNAGGQSSSCLDRQAYLTSCKVDVVRLACLRVTAVLKL